MSLISITDNLRNVIKEKRAESKIGGATLSKLLGKGASYISQIESGKIKSIDPVTLIELFNKIVDLPESNFKEFISNILEECPHRMSKEEYKHEEWMILFDYQIRQFPIEDSLVNWIESKLKELNISAIELANKVNQNEGITFDQTIKSENKIYIKMIPTENGFSIEQTIKFNIPLDTIERIINKEIIKTNYIQMQGIIWNIFRIEGFDELQSLERSHSILYENHIMTLDERNKFINEKIKEKKSKQEDFTLYDIIPTDIEKTYNELFNQIIDRIRKFLIFIRDKDVINAVEKVEQLNENLKFDTPLLFKIMMMNFSDLKNTTKEERYDFLKKTQESLDNFINSTSSERDNDINSYD